jgi:DNA-directed RNA polymerase specialized sigma subunit
MPARLPTPNVSVSTSESPLSQPLPLVFATMPVSTTQRAFLQSLAGSATCVASRTVETKERREKLASKVLRRRRQATVQHQQVAAVLGLTTEEVVTGMLTANHQKHHEPF